MKTILIIIFILLLSFTGSFAQRITFITGGSIEFEKSVNTFAIIKKMLGKNPMAVDLQRFEQYQKTRPQFKVLKSTLIFGGNRSLFTPTASEVTTFPLFVVPMTDQNNKVYTDIPAQTNITQKSIYDGTFLVKDSVRKIDWKLTDETREIAGYTCRRANALILDSIYVVAFYTDDIHFSGGPELFSGLPGMILEVALPHDNVIWRATKITTITVPSQTIVPPKKGKTINNKELNELVKAQLKKGNDPVQIDLLRKSLLL